MRDRWNITNPRKVSCVNQVTSFVLRMGTLSSPMSSNPLTELCEEHDVFSTNLLNTYYVPCTLLGAMDRRVNKTKTSVAIELHSSDKHKGKAPERCMEY